MHRLIVAALLLAVQLCHGFVPALKLTRRVISSTSPFHIPSWSISMDPSTVTDQPTPSNCFVNEPIVAWHERAYILFGNPSRAHLANNFLDVHALYLTYQALFGVPRHVLKQHVALLHYQSNLEFSCRWLDGSTNWEKVGGGYQFDGTWNLPCGKDLFIKGMGSFEVQASYNRIVDRRRRLHKEELLWKTLDIFGKLPHELEKLSPAVLLDSCDHDSIFHAAMKMWLEKELAEGIATSDNKRRDAARMLQKRLLLERVMADPVPRMWAYNWLLAPQPYWYVTIPHLWLEGYFPELLEDASTQLPPLHNLTLQDALVESRKARQNVDPNRLATCGRIGRILMNDGGRIFWKSKRKPQEPRNHFIKYLYDWKQRLGSLDELLMFFGPAYLQWPSGGMSLRPKQLLEYVHNELEVKQNIRFYYLDNLPDSPPNLKVLRTTYEIFQVGKALQNCATNYIRNVESKKCALVAYYKDEEEGIPLALGMFALNVYQPPACGRWTQIYMTRNEPPTAEVLDAYEKYTPTIRDWLHLEIKKGEIPLPDQ